jgi:hypothetical protein
MSTALESHLAKLSKRQKLALAERLLADAGLHAKPPGIRSVDDPKLEAEVRRRLADKRPGAWLTMEEFRQRVGQR